MNKKYLSSPVRTAIWARIFAKLIDLFIVIILIPLFYPLGLLGAIIYLSLSDSLQNGQSLGKKFVGFSVISLIDRMPCTRKQSFIRNLPFILPLSFSIIPFVGWILTLLIGIPIILFELYLVFKIDSGHRLGDVMSDTSVIAGGGEDGVKSSQMQITSWYSTSQ